MEAERSDRLGGKGRKGKQGGTVVVLNQQKTIQPANSKRPFMGKGEGKEKGKGQVGIHHLNTNASKNTTYKIQIQIQRQRQIQIK